MSEKRTTLHKRGHQGMSEQMANEINRQQASKAMRKMGSRKIHTSKPKQGYTPQRSGVDISTL